MGSFRILPVCDKIKANNCRILWDFSGFFGNSSHLLQNQRNKLQDFLGFSGFFGILVDFTHHFTTSVSWRILWRFSIDPSLWHSHSFHSIQFFEKKNYYSFISFRSRFSISSLVNSIIFHLRVSPNKKQNKKLTIKKKMAAALSPHKQTDSRTDPINIFILLPQFHYAIPGSFQLWSCCRIVEPWIGLQPLASQKTGSIKLADDWIDD